MIDHQIDYASLVEKALLRVVHDALGTVAEHGLPGRHHLYVTFRTDHPGVVMDDALHARYPGEMTIVLQHEFWGLEVTDDRFAVTLSFNSVSQRIEVPFAAVTVFADPSVEFGLQFTRTGAPAPEAVPETPSEPATPSPASVAKLPAAAEIGPDGDGQQAPAATERVGEEAKERIEPGADRAKGADKVVTLDRFRKR